MLKLKYLYFIFFIEKKYSFTCNYDNAQAILNYR